MSRWCLLLLMLVAAPSAYSACDVKSPVQEIFAYPQLMRTHVTFHDYEIRVFDSLSCDGPIFKNRSGVEVLKAGNRVYSQTGWSFSIGYPLEDDQSPDSVPVPPGTDITGNGLPDLLISEWSGGAHCCYTFHIFELGNNLRKIQSIPVFDADGSAFVKRPGIKSLVLDTADYSAFAYFPSGFAGSPAGRVFLSYQQGRFRLDTALMRATPPKPGEIGKCAALFKRSREWKTAQPLGMWYYTTDLIYTGHESDALKFLEGSWGGSAADRDRYLAEYQQRLKKSVYYPELSLLQSIGPSATDQKIDWTKQCFEYLQG